MSSVPLFFAFFDVGGPEVLVIMFIVLLLFGGERLPELAKGLGKSIREFKKAASNVEDELKRAIEEAPERIKPQPKLANPIPPAASLPPTASSDVTPALSPAVTPALPPGEPPSETHHS